MSEELNNRSGAPVGQSRSETQSQSGNQSQPQQQSQTQNQPQNDSQPQQSKPTPKIVRVNMQKAKPMASGLIVTLVIIGLTLGSWFFFSNNEPKGEAIPQSDLVSKISKGEYEQIIERDGFVIIEQKKTEVINENKYEYLTRYYSDVKLDTGSSFYDTLIASGIKKEEIRNYTYKPDNSISFGDIFLVVAFSLGLYMIFMLIRNMNSSGGKIFEFGQSKARLLFGKKTGIMFADVAGIDDAKEELIEIVDFLKSPKKYIDAGARIPKGVLLIGAPGTGKTLLAKAIAGEAGVPFFHTSGSEFEEMLVGAGASRVRDLFSKAKKTSPCIIFIDEIDAIAKKRGTVVSAGNTEQTLNQLLVEMDGLEGRENVIILGATNRPDVLDPAILRPGRFDRTVTVQMPDYEGRKQILAVHAKNKKFEKDVDMDLVAKKTVGYSGADLENLLNEAAIMAAKENKKVIAQAELMEAYLKVKLGRKKKSKSTDDDIKRVAYHEAGHAVVAKFTKNSDPVEKISILPRGQSGGVTVFVPDDDSRLVTKTKMMSYVNHLVAGKVAEEVFLGEMSTGPSSDLKGATDLVKAYVKQYGMSEKLGFIQYADLDELDLVGYQYGSKKDYSEKTAEMIDEEIRKLVDDAQKSAKDILEKNRDKVEALVKLLLEKEVVDREEFDALFA